MRRLAIILSFVAAPLVAQQTTISIEEYDPHSTLVVPQHPRPRSKFPFIDIHAHQRRDISEADEA